MAMLLLVHWSSVAFNVVMIQVREAIVITCLAIDIVLGFPCKTDGKYSVLYTSLLKRLSIIHGNHQ